MSLPSTIITLSGVQLDGATKLTDNQLKTSGDNTITFPSGGGTLATTDDVANAGGGGGGDETEALKAEISELQKTIFTLASITPGHTKYSGTETTINITDNNANLNNYFYNLSDVTSITLNTSNIVLANSLFGYCKKLETLTITWDSSRILVADNMFNNCRKLSNIGDVLNEKNFDTLVSASHMFYWFGYDVSQTTNQFDKLITTFPKLRYANSMFYHSRALGLDCSNWTLESLESANSMFWEVGLLYSPVSFESTDFPSLKEAMNMFGRIAFYGGVNTKYGTMIFTGKGFKKLCSLNVFSYSNINLDDMDDDLIYTINVSCGSSTNKPTATSIASSRAKSS